MTTRVHSILVFAGLSVIAGSAAVSVAQAQSVAQGVADPGPRPVTSTEAQPHPIDNLTPTQLALFTASTDIFKEVEKLADGLGPRFNLDSCGGCHSQPALGGSSPAHNPQTDVFNAFGAQNTLPSFITANGPIREARFKFTPGGNPDGGVHSLFVITGRDDGSLKPSVPNNCNIRQEDFATQVQNGNVALRIPTPVFGLGLIEQISDDTIAKNLAANGNARRSLGISGHLNRNGNDGRVSRFGWKAQNQTGMIFSGEAYNVEMGITNEEFQVERDQAQSCQLVPMPNSVLNTDKASPTDYLSDIERFAAFMRFLKPAQQSTTTPGGAASISRGQTVFTNIGCSLCHTPQLVTAASTVAALSNQPANLFSDLALHNMGPGLADGIRQGEAGGQDFRTAPLWGLGQRLFLLHDGRTSNLITAIFAHSSGSAQAGNASEANAVVNNFANNLSPGDQQALLNFLRSL
jgi:CxxC motif-containing protein (DUF1111 family)